MLPPRPSQPVASLSFAQDQGVWKRIDRLVRWRFVLFMVAANQVGALICTVYFLYFDKMPLPPPAVRFILHFLAVMIPLLVIIGIYLVRNRLVNVLAYIKNRRTNEPSRPGVKELARREILNLPFSFAFVTLVCWGIASVTIPLCQFRIHDLSPYFGSLAFEMFRSFVGVVLSGVITCAIVFFFLEAMCARVWPYFFPDGGLSEVKKAIRVSVRTRLYITFLMCSVLPLTDMGVLAYQKASLMRVMDPEVVLKDMLYFIIFAWAVEFFAAGFLAHYVAQTIAKPVSAMSRAMIRLQKGDLNARVEVLANSELGLLGEHFNRMTDGLKEYIRLQRALALAMEVQQLLLPRGDPKIAGLDISGKSIYCEQTGGDYYDFIPVGNRAGKKIAVVVGDASDHGIPSALLMATTRALLRQRAALPGDIGAMVRDINFQLVRDVEESGRFMSLFFLEIDTESSCFRWVRAGHDPALLYDPETDAFEQLKGRGMTLGVDPDARYSARQRTGLKKGAIIALFTDGIFEARNTEGRMFGKDPIREVIRAHRDKSAAEIVDAVFHRLARFRGPRHLEDDATLVVVKR